MPHDDNNPGSHSFLAKNPRLVPVFYAFCGLAGITWLTYLFGPEWMTSKLDMLMEPLLGLFK